MKGMKHLARPVRAGLALMCLLRLAICALAQDRPVADSAGLDYWRAFVREQNPQLDLPAQKKLALELQQNARRTLEVQRAIEQGDLAAVQQLLDEGADLDARNEQGETALHLATRHENLSLMRLLINAGADREIANAAGQTPLLLAAGLESQARFLPAPDFHPFLRWVQNVPEARAWITTNLPSLVPRSQTITPLDYLLARRADPGAVNTNGESALHLAWTGYRVDPVPVPEVDQLVATLVRAGVSPDAKDRAGRTPLHLAVAERGGWAKAHALLQAGANPDARDQLGRTPLHTWILSDFPDEQLATLLLTNRADLNAQDHEGNTPLHLALYKTFVGPVDFLVKHGADPAIANHTGRSPLMLKETKTFGGGFGMAALRPPGANFQTFREALGTGPAAEVALWLQADPKLTRVEYPLGDTPLLLAERRGDPAIVELIRRHQAGQPAIAAEPEPPEGTSPFPRGQLPQFARRPESLPGDLLAAALRGDTGEVMAAVKSRPELLRLAQQSETLLLASARKGHHELVLALLTAGADPLVPDNHSRTALTHAWQLEDPITAQTLLDHGAREDIHGMAAAGKLDRLQPLLRAHPDWLNRTNARGHAVLHSAAFNGQKAVAEWLLDQGANLELRTADYWGWTPLHCAVYAGQPDLMHWLIQRGADARTTDHNGKTLLHEALLTRNLQLVGPLLDLALPLNAVDQQGHTALDYARFAQGLPGGPELYQRLVAAGATNGPGPNGSMGRPILAPIPSPGQPAR